MKKWMAIVTILALAGPAAAQMVGLPVATGAGASEAGLFQAGAGLVLGDDFNMYGGRVTFAPAQGLALFGDAGVIDYDTSAIKTGFGVQGGGLFTLPLDLPFDLAARGSLGVGKADLKGSGDVTWFSLTAGLVASKTFEQITPYGYFGLHYVRAEVKSGRFKSSDDETDPGLGAGVLFAVTPQISFYAELMHVDDLFVGAGGIFRF